VSPADRTTGPTAGSEAGVSVRGSTGTDAGTDPRVVRGSVAASVARELVAALVDDAATFPPANATMLDVVQTRAMYEDSWFAELLGPVVLRADRAPEVLAALAVTGSAARTSTAPLPVTVTVPGGPAAVRAAVAAVADPALDPVSFEVPLGPAGPEPSLLRSTRLQLPGRAPLYVELPGSVDPVEAMPVLREAGVRAKLRTGGTSAAAFPDASSVARFVHAAVTAGVPFKATAGLQNALRHRDEDTAFEHHGFVNLLAATTAVLLHGAGEPQVQALLSSRDAEQLLELLTSLDADQAHRVREAFVSFGSCSTVEPVEDLAALGLIARPGLEVAVSRRGGA